jgi:hypothetical protein
MTATATLRELGDAKEILDQFLLETEGEETPEIADLWEQLQGQTSEKVERWGLWILERNGDLKKLKEEEERITARRRAIENAIDRSKAELLHQLRRVGRDRVQGLVCTVAIQNNSQPAVNLLAEAEAFYATEEGRAFVKREEIVTYSLDRAAVLAAWEAKQPLPAAIDVRLGQHLRVR